jgi:hypothetical protein
MKFLYFPFVQYWSYATILYVTLCGIADAGLYLTELPAHLYRDTYFAKVLQMNTLCSTEYISEAY